MGPGIFFDARQQGSEPDARDATVDVEAREIDGG
jgi:hypothetical protein